MKIDRIESFPVPPRWIFVRVTLDDGLQGWGESILPKRVRAVTGAIADLADNLMGADPRRIEDIWQRLYRGAFFRGGPVLMTALAGIEQALWDIKGKALGIPVYEFLGGLARERVRAYAWVGGDRPDQVVEQVGARLEQGFRAVKMNATHELHYVDRQEKIDAVVARVHAIRDAFGDAVDIALDFHGRVHRTMAYRLAEALQPYHLLWVEEPVLPEHMDLLVERPLGIPVAAGERLYTRWEVRRWLHPPLVDILQPDVSCTGIFELEKIARMAEAYDIALAPHCPNGPISLAATLQVDACVPNVVIQEQSQGIHYHQGYQGLAAKDLLSYLVDSGPLRVREGWLYPPSGPGLGIQVDEAEVQRVSQSLWRLPDIIWRQEDGTMAEW